MRPMRVRFVVAVCVALIVVGACADRPSTITPSPAATAPPAAATASTPAPISIPASPIASAVVATPSATPPTPASADPQATASSGPSATPSIPATSAPPSNEEPGGRTSADLIRAAVAAGSLDDATGLLYRVYAVFGDPRLPAEFATGVAHEDFQALMRAPLDIDRLPAAVADQLRPYVVRPTDPSSLFFDTSAAEATGDATLAAVRTGSLGKSVPQAISPVEVVCDPVTRWGSALGTHRFKVWGRCGDATSDDQIRQTVAAMDPIWKDETAYMGRDPIEDTGSPDHGGDTRIDIYLVVDCVTRDNQRHCVNPAEGGLTLGSLRYEITNGVAASSAFILIPRRLLADPFRLRTALAHEMFHALELAHNNEGFAIGDGAIWLMDASAVWAVWRFIPGSGPIEITQFFRAFQGTGASLQSDAGLNPYLSFAWPLFLEQKGGDGTVKRAWVATRGKANDVAIMDAVNGVVSFESEFRTFAMRVWNRELGIGPPVDPLLPNGATGGSTPRVPRTATAGAVELLPTREGATPITNTESIPTLYGRYRPYKVHDDVGKIIVDFSGLASAATLDIDALVKVKGKWEHRELPPGQTTWCTDDEKDDIEEFVIVLSNHERVRPTPPIQGDWTVESPRTPCLSYHITIEWTDVWDNVPDTVVFEGYADVVDPDAIGEVTVLTGTGTVTGSRSAYIACNPGLAGSPTSGSADALFVAVIEGEKVTVNAFGDYTGLFGGVTTWPFEVPRRGGEKRLEGADLRPGAICPHEYSGTATVRIQLRDS